MGQVLPPTGSRTWQLWLHGSGLTVKKDAAKGLWRELRKATEVRHMAGKSLHGGPEKLLFEATKLKPELHWRPEEVVDIRV